MVCRLTNSPNYSLDTDLIKGKSESVEKVLFLLPKSDRCWPMSQDGDDQKSINSQLYRRSDWDVFEWFVQTDFPKNVYWLKLSRCNSSQI